MATLQNAIDLFLEDMVLVKLFGSEVGWEKERAIAFRKIGETFMSESEIDDSQKATKASRNDGFGPETQEAYNQFIALLRIKGHLNLKC